MKGYKKILKRIALYPFHPLYNMGENKYSLSSKNSFLSNDKKIRLVKEDIVEHPIPTFIDISDKDYESIIKTPIVSVEDFKIKQNNYSLFVSYLVCVLLGKENECWWIDSMITELQSSFNIDFLFRLQTKYRELLWEINPNLKIYVPYHWAELALLTFCVKNNNLFFAKKIEYEDSVNTHIQEIINKEYREFIVSLDSKKLSQVHKECIMKNLIIMILNSKVKFGMPFPFDTKGKKIEKVNIKIIKNTKQSVRENEYESLYN